MNDPSGDQSSSSSSGKPPEADISDTHSEHNKRETDQGQSSGSQQPSQPHTFPRYYVRSAARHRPPPSPDQIPAGKDHILEGLNIDRRPHSPRPLTVVKQTTTSRIKPPVPPAQPSPSGIVPLGPPPPREPRRIRTNSPPPAAPLVGRFDHLPPPSLSFDDAGKITKEFVEKLEKAKDELDESKLKDLMLALQVDLGLPPETGLFEMLDSNGKMENVIGFLCDYFQTSEVPPADD